MRYRLRMLLLIAAALPIWLYLIAVVPQSTGFGGGLARFVVAPITLIGIASAIFWLLKKVPDRLGWAVFAAAVISLGSLTAFYVVQTLE